MIESEQPVPEIQSAHSTGASSRLSAVAPLAVTGNCVPDPAWGTLQSTFAAQVVQLTNQHRTGMGLSLLTVAPVLRSIAEWKSLNMAGYLYMDHNDPAPVARSISDRFAACGYPTNAAWGENIAYGFVDAQATVTAWLSDIGHKMNIENPSWKTIGVAVGVAANGLMFWTQDFGTTGVAPTPPPPPSPPPTPPPPDPTPPPTGSPFDRWKASAYPELKGWPSYQTWRDKKMNQHDVRIIDALLRDPTAPGVPTTAFGLFLADTIRVIAS